MNREYFKYLYQRILNMREWNKFKTDLEKFNQESKNKNCIIADKENLLPCLADRTTTIEHDVHYIYHPAWAARILAKINPKEHVDISSITSFCTILSAFIPTRYYEYRPVNFNLDNLRSFEVDLVKLPFENDSIVSLSCMHVIEHIGLGRYGDELDPLGDRKAIQELQRVVKKGGSLLFVVPIGREKIIFNAHRIYSYERIMKYFSGWKLRDFSLVIDDGTEINKKCGFGLNSVLFQDESNKKNNDLKDCYFIQNAKKEEADKQNYGCGCFWFEKAI